MLESLQTDSEEEGIYLVFGSISATKFSIRVCFQQIHVWTKYIGAVTNAQDVLLDFP